MKKNSSSGKSVSFDKQESSDEEPPRKPKSLDIDRSYSARKSLDIPRARTIAPEKRSFEFFRFSPKKNSDESTPKKWNWFRKKGSKSSDSLLKSWELLQNNENNPPTQRKDISGKEEEIEEVEEVETPQEESKAKLPNEPLRSSVQNLKKLSEKRSSLDDNMFEMLKRDSIEIRNKKTYIHSGYRDAEKYQHCIDDVEIHKLVDQAIMWENIDIPNTQYECSFKLKMLIRRGIPDPKRGRIWKIVTGCAEFMAENPHFYSDMLHKVFGERLPSTILHVPTFGGESNPQDYYLTAEGEAIVKRILCVLGMEHPDIEYLPVLHDLVFILLHFMTEAETYSTIHMLILNTKDKQSTKKYFTPSKKGITLFLYTFDDLIKKCAPKIFNHMKTLDTNAHKFADKWFMRMFVSVLPFQTVLRVFDAFLNEGSKVLYRVALAVLKLSMNELLKTKTETEFLQVLEYKALQVIDAESLMKKAFSIRLKRRHFEDLDNKNKAKVSTVVEPRIPVYYRPRISFTSNIVAEEQYEILWSWLPHRYCIRDPELLFSTAIHGCSLLSFFNTVDHTAPTIIVIKTTQQEVFGAFVSHAWKKSMSFYGDRDCFLWRFTPSPQKYGWTEGRKDYFMLVSDKDVQVGGGDGVGLWLDNELLKGRTTSCQAFENPPLTKDGREDFECLAVEVFKFQ